MEELEMNYHGAPPFPKRPMFYEWSRLIETDALFLDY
jgi:hypothetical protein